MPMEIDRKLLKDQAHQAMFAVRPSFWVVTLVYFIMTTGLSTLADFAPGELALFLSVGLTFYNWVVRFSYHLWAIWTCRKLDPDLGSLMEGFSIPGRVILLEMSILVRTVGWTVLLVLPAVLVFSPLILLLPPELTFLSSVVYGVAIALVLEIVLLRYTLAPYILADFPDLGPGIALAHSVRLTKGWRVELLKLYLSFAGWYIAEYLLAGLGMALGIYLSGGLDQLLHLSMDQMAASLQVMVSAPLAMALGNLFCLPVSLYRTPYVEVTTAQFYEARINLSDNMANPLGNIPR